MIKSNKLKLFFEDKYPEETINNTLSILNIALKYNVKTIGIGYWMNDFKESYSYVLAFYKNKLNTSDTFIKIENNCFCNEKFKRTKDFYWSNFPKIWKICEEFDEINKTKFDLGAGNSGQYQFKTNQFINGIWKYSNNNWQLIS